PIRAESSSEFSPDRLGGRRYTEFKEGLGGVESMQALVEKAEAYALEVFPTFLDEVPGLKANNPHLVNVLERGDYQGVNPESSEYIQLLQANSLRQKITREVILDQLQDPQ